MKRSHLNACLFTVYHLLSLNGFFLKVTVDLLTLSTETVQNSFVHISFVTLKQISFSLYLLLRSSFHIQTDAILLASSVVGNTKFIVIYWGIKVGLWVDISHRRLDDVSVHAGGSRVTVRCPPEGGLHPRWKTVPILEWPSGTTQRKNSRLLFGRCAVRILVRTPNYWYCRVFSD
jgi:hypothetical protein